MSDSDALRGRDVGGVCPHTGSAAFPAQRQVRITCLWREKRNQEGSCQAPTAGYCRGRVPAVAAGRLACPALVSSPLQDKRTASQRWQSLGRARQISLRQHRGSRHAARSARVARAAHAGRGAVHLAGNPALIAIVPPPATPAAAAGRRQDHNDRQNHQPLHALAPENGRAGREGPFRRIGCRPHNRQIPSPRRLPIAHADRLQWLRLAGPRNHTPRVVMCKSNSRFFSTP